MSIRKLHHLVHASPELLNSKRLSRFDRYRIALLRGQISLPTMTAEKFDLIQNNLHLSYAALASLIGVSEQRLLRYRKESHFPPSIALLLTILHNEESNFFLHYEGADKMNYGSVVSNESELITQATEASVIESRMYELTLNQALRDGKDATIETQTSSLESVHIVPIRIKQN